MQIPLTKGLYATVCEQDFPALAQHKWHAVKGKGTHYAARRVGDKTVYMHRYVLGLVDAPRDVCVDHKDRNGLNNQRENLRACTHKENAQNRGYRTDFTGMRGVRLESSGRWSAYLRNDGRLVHLGTFDNEKDAGIAYAAVCRFIGRSV
jgi:hypothetical protein